MESVVAIFKTPDQAVSALNTLQSRGFHKENLGFAMTDINTQSEITSITGVKPEKGIIEAGTGGVKGLVIGTIVGAFFTGPIWLLLQIIPSTQAFAEGGSYLTLFGAIGGAALGFLFGALAGNDEADYVKLFRTFGVPDIEAEKFYNRMKRGNIIIVARDRDVSLTKDASQIMKDCGAVDLNSIKD